MHSLVILAYAAAVSASFGGNINYRSPSHHHPALGVSIPKVAKRNVEGRAFPASKLNFTHGVASGDPYATSVILWTRAAPMMGSDQSNTTVDGLVQLYNHETKKWIKLSKNPVCLKYQVATDPELQSVVTKGTAYTTSDIDYTVKVEATGLEPFTTYYYQFSVCGSTVASPVGRTKTAPAPRDHVSELRFAVYSCSNYPFGFFNSYGNSVRKDSVDYVIHLGDYIYEYPNGDYGYGQTLGRVPEPDDYLYTLGDYRTRHNQYRTDLDLVLSSQAFAWIPVWDDHEVSDNTWKAGAGALLNNENSFVEDGGVSVDQRKMNAVRAYFEWMPIRQVEMDDNLRIWRNFQLGDLLDLVMLDTRQYDRSITDIYVNTEYIKDISNDAGRSMMGPRQEKWFYDTLSESADRGAAWRLIGSQTVFSRMNQSKFYEDLGPGIDFNFDQWDGYLANRNRTLSHMYRNGIGNNILIAGDSHENWVSDLVWINSTTDTTEYDPITGRGAIGVEFAGSAVGSPSPMGQNISIHAGNLGSQWLVDHNPELQWQETYYRGYFELVFTHQQVEARFFGMPTIVKRNAFEISMANFTVQSGNNALDRPIGKGIVENGVMQAGMTMQTNLTNDTSVPGGKWFISHFNQEDL